MTEQEGVVVPSEVKVEKGSEEQRARGNWICPWVQTLQQEICMYLLLWYNASLVTLWVNKYLLTDLGVDSNALSTIQAISCILCGKLYDIYRGVDSYAIDHHPHEQEDTLPRLTRTLHQQHTSETERTTTTIENDDEALESLMSSRNRRSSSTIAKHPKSTVEDDIVPKPPTFRTRVKKLMHSKVMKDMTALGIMRLLNVYLGLTALKYVAVSFTETVKSSAPFFTVILSYIVLNEKTPALVNASLIPIVLGLVLCSMSDTSYNIIGFTAAICANCSDCMQNVMSKKLLNQYSVSTIQMYTCIVAVVFQAPFMLSTAFTTGIIASKNNDVSTMHVLTYIVIDGLAFYSQSMLTYGLMSIVSPLTHSVANTAKRALLIVLSVQHFGNPIGFANWVGMALVIFGVFGYNHAHKIVARRRRLDDTNIV